MPGYPCCCQVYPCTDHCSSGVPDSLTVTISGAMDDTCSWTGLDGSYVLPFLACTTWRATFTTPVVTQNSLGTCYGSGGGYQLKIWVWLSAGKLYGYISVQWIGHANLQEQHYFESTISLPTDCCFWTAQSIAYSARQTTNTDFGGDLSTSSFTITSSAAGC